MTYPNHTVGYAYDAAGRRLSMEDPIGTTSYGYDGAGRITAVTSPQGSLYYGYDAASRRTSIQYPGSRSVTYGYDLAGRLRAITDWAGQQVAYDYDDAGRKLGQTNANGTDAAYSYDTAGRLATITHTGPGGTLASFSYDRDSAGNPLSVQEQMSLVSGGTLGYGYDRLGRLTTVTYPGPLDVSYAYDPMGNRTQLVDAQGTSSYSYDTSDRLLLITGPQSLSFSWDPRGNQTGKGGQSFGYDGANRLASANTGQSSATYSYNGEGVRVGKTVDSVTTSYLQDQVGGLPHVLLETTGQQETLYLYGLGLALQVNPDGSRRYYHTDALGSTRVVTDDSGDAVSGYSYDAYGAVRDQAGEGRSFTFTGEQLDSETSLVFLRARYYDPAIGRFPQKDVVLDLSGTQGINRYIYVRNRPIAAIDPTGLLTFFVGGIGGSEKDEYRDFVEQMRQMGIQNPAGPHSAYDAPARFGVKGLLSSIPLVGEGVAKAAHLGLNVMDVALYALWARGDLDAIYLANEIRFRRQFLEEGEQVNIVAYSGGATVAYNALRHLQELDPHFKIDNLVVVGGAAPTSRRPCNVGNYTAFTGKGDLLIRLIGAIRMDAAEGATMDKDWGHLDYFGSPQNRKILIQKLKDAGVR